MSEKKPILHDYFERFAELLFAFYEISSIQTSADNLGANREYFHNTFLSKVLPSRLSIGKGEIWDSQGNSTGQLDTIIIRDDAPKLTFEGERDTFLVEGVFSVIEVKSNLTREKLREAGRTLEKVRDLHIEYPSFQSGSGPLFDGPFRIVFAYTGATESTLIEEIKQNNWHDLFDLICILNRGVYEKNPDLSSFKDDPYIYTEGKGITLAKLYYLLVLYCQGYISRRIVLKPYLEPWENWS